MKIFKTRVKFTVKDTKVFGVRYLYKNKNYSGGYYVKSGDGKSIYSIQLLENVEKI